MYFLEVTRQISGGFNATILQRSFKASIHAIRPGNSGQEEHFVECPLPISHSYYFYYTDEDVSFLTEYGKLILHKSWER